MRIVSFGLFAAGAIAAAVETIKTIQKFGDRKKEGSSEPELRDELRKMMAPGQGGMRGGSRGIGGGGNIFGLVRDVASTFSGSAGRQSQQYAQAVNEEFRRQVELLKEERRLLKEHVDLLERRLGSLEMKRKENNNPEDG